MTALTANQLLVPERPLARERVETPELGEGAYVVVRTLDGFEREQWERQFIGIDGKSSIVNAMGGVASLRVKLASICLCDDQGQPLFAKGADSDALGKLPAKVLDRVYLVALRLSGLAEESLEDAEKNSAPGESSGTGSDSPAT